MAISPLDQNTLFWGTGGLYISTDGGKTWQDYGSGLGGNGWELKNAPIGSSFLYAQGMHSELYLSKDGGRNWGTIGSGHSLSFDNSGKNLFVLYNNRNFAISRDDGTTWEEHGLPADNAQAIAIHPIIPNRVYALFGKISPNEIFYSDDLGKTWLNSTGMKDVGDPRLFFDHPQGNLVYAIGDLVTSRSNDAGLTWQDCGIFQQLWASKSDMRGAVDPRSSDHLFIATRGNGIVASQDYCKSWQPSNTDLESLFVNTIAIDQNLPDVMYAATDGGAYFSNDSGQTWHKIDDGLLGATVVYSIVVDKDGNVYGSTPYGVFRLEKK